jgi:hypothetical protein
VEAPVAVNVCILKPPAVVIDAPPVAIVPVFELIEPSIDCHAPLTYISFLFVVVLYLTSPLTGLASPPDTPVAI